MKLKDKLTMSEKDLEVSVRYKPRDSPGEFNVEIHMKGDITKIRNFLKGFSV